MLGYTKKLKRDFKIQDGYLFIKKDKDLIPIELKIKGTKRMILFLLLNLVEYLVSNKVVTRKEIYTALGVPSFETHTHIDRSDLDESK